MFGRGSRAGLGTIKQRQYERNIEVTQAVVASLLLLEDPFGMQPGREYRLFASSINRVPVASDASYENG